MGGGRNSFPINYAEVEELDDSEEIVEDEIVEEVEDLDELEEIVEEESAEEAKEDS